ncbi:Phophatidylserine decarboxylase-domain-containing protein [Ilyonectria robusta]|uniref:Phophatidylserine decarboxylase-domain-containing protein n=1 Tax=Ilyonectria robusta TaxID=1079257 RepID=UPI001E8E826B|nr:Phophatidylserine decarboxylase-domain-containing protein [Ilyonectria robusta]KAH8685338.1 Phophatidylserine decarboxylase-domain-containing protein [Ilyonectria robusta]
MVTQHGEYSIPDEHRVHKPGAWLPADHRIHQEYLRRVITHVDETPQQLLPVIEEFQQLIETTPRIYMYFVQMFDEASRRKPYVRESNVAAQMRDHHHMLQVLNHILSQAPQWSDAEAGVGMIGVPMCAVFDYEMGTPSGHAAFLDPDVNRMMKKLLNEWGKYLQTPESASVLGDDRLGWFGKTGMADLMEVANAPNKSSFKFEEMYICDPSAEHYGFKSWDDFFTRRVHDSARPVAHPNDDSVIANACESTTFHAQHGVKLRDEFFNKGQPYSVLDMLAHDPLASAFEGGTVYQAFLSALSYHRWHAPVSGTVRRAFVQEGTYFSVLLSEEVGEPDVSETGVEGAQGYLSAMATRGIIVIEADNADIGLVAFIAIGMEEVSTCEITVREGQHVVKGDETGMFHFGGSTYCMLFQKGVELEGLPEVAGRVNVPVRSQLGVVKKKK